MRRAPALAALALLAAGCLGAQGAGTPIDVRVGDLLLHGTLGGRDPLVDVALDGPSDAGVQLVGLRSSQGGVSVSAHGRSYLLEDARMPASLVAGDLEMGAYAMALPEDGEAVRFSGTADELTVTFATVTRSDGHGGLGSLTVSAPAVKDGSSTLLRDGAALLDVVVDGAEVRVKVLDRSLALHGVRAAIDADHASIHVTDQRARLVLDVQLVEGPAGAAVLVTGPAVDALAPGSDALALLVARGDGAARVGALATERSTWLLDARTGAPLLPVATTAAPSAVVATAASVEVHGAKGRIVAAGADGLRALGPAGDAAVVWNSLTGSLLVAPADGSPLVAGLLGGGASLPQLYPLPASAPRSALLDGGLPLAGEAGSLVARLVGPLAVPASLPLDVSLAPSEPFDPEGPWTVGAIRARVGTGAGSDVLLAGPLVLRTTGDGFDRLQLVSPTGDTFAELSCGAGSCTLASALGTHELPAGTLHVDGDLHQGRPTGARVVGPDARVLLHLTLFGPDGARVTGSSIDTPLTLGPFVALEGDPRDLDRIVVHLPDGTEVLDARPGASGVGSIEIAGQAVPLPLTGAHLEGDPLSDEEATLLLTLKDRQTRYALPSARGRLDPLANATAPVLVLRDPLGPRPVSITLISGPTRLVEDGALSPRHDLLIRVLVPGATGYERGRALLGTVALAELVAAGSDNGSLVFLGRAPSWMLPTTNATAARLLFEFTRELAPGFSQAHEPASRELTFDSEGPPAPDPAPSDEGFAWGPVPGAARYEAEAGREDGETRPVPVNGTEAQVPDAPGNWTGRVRALDPHDNPGEWSSDVEWTQTSTGGGPAPTEPRLSLSDPTAGSTVNGTVRVHWEPDPSVALVRVEVSADAGETWTEVGVASEPPIEWDTRAYADGTYVVRVLAEGPAGSTSELVPDIIVDNLSPLQPSEATGIATIVAPPPGTDPDPRPAGTSTPLPTAIAASLVLLAAACVAAWLFRRATSK